MIRYVWLLAAVTLVAAITEAAAEGTPTSIQGVATEKVANTVLVVYGVHDFPDGKNKGVISNSGIVLTDAGVVVIDSGGSYAAGKLVISELRKITDKPVVAVFNTHFHGDHWLGNAAFHEAFPDAPIYAHEVAIARLEGGEAERWHNVISELAGPENAGRNPVLPDRGLKGGEVIEIGGVAFEVHYTGPAHTSGDLMIELPGEKLLFAGDIIIEGNMPSFGAPQDLDLNGQIAALEYVLALPVDTVVPGHGITAGRVIANTPLRFFNTLHDSVKRYYEAGMQDYEMRDKVAADLAEYSKWHGFGELGRLISFVYLKVEEADFQ